ncbi:ABC transporter permease [Roseiterribacter gracilis]|uniref:Peptide ABC transporter permease n=1 Tax=Roseiterribacter gracilis TaxID=2812848 RepID=A0A8S8X7B3_9PROT|nr:peptide ABC transporter permease [Rhodospirillales bacterium TMPK1]
MLRYAALRLLATIPTLFLVAVIVFGLIRLVPGDPASIMIGDSADPDMIEQVRKSLGLDKPVLVQFFVWLGNLLEGDFGRSITTGEDILPAMLTRLRVTAGVVLASIVVALLFALPAGIYAAWRQNSRVDFAIVTGVIVALSVPSFWVGILLMLVFGVNLHWLPVVGYVSIGDDFINGVRYLILPVAALVMVEMGTVARMTRSSTIEVLRLDYITHARAKGAPESRVLWKHAFPNAFAPTLTVIGLLLGHMLGGVAVIETVFTLPGLGRFLVDAISSRDYPVIQGCLLLVALIRVMVNLLVDLLYPLFDPRVRL